MKQIGKYIRVCLLFMLFCLYPFVSCDHKTAGPDRGAYYCDGDKQSVLERIKQRGKLVATTDYNSISYFVYRGQPMGYQFEMLSEFADYLDVKLEILVNNDIDDAFESIESGEADLIGLDLTITKERSKMFDFSMPLGQTRQVLVQKKPDGWRKMSPAAIDDSLLRNPLELAGKTIHLQSNTSHIRRMMHLSDEIGDTIFLQMDSEKTVEELIAMVSKGEIGYTVSDEHVAMVNQKYYPNIDVATAVSFPQNFAWAVKKGSYDLLSSINLWLSDFQNTKTARFIYNRYFRNPRSAYMAQSEYHSVSGGKISRYDDIIKEQSEILGWDWRLLASLIYQESGFNPEVRSWVGAFGLMQLMPETANRYGVDTNSSARENIEAGVKLLRWLDEQFQDIVPDTDERRKFVMASYNVGIAHVYDAMRLAEKYDKDPYKWTDNVDGFILNKSKPKYYNDPVAYYGYARGEEPYNFVIEILERFDHYRNVIIN